MDPIKIYLCGSIKKGSEDTDKRTYWGEEEEKHILDSFKNKYNIKLLNPGTIGIKRVDSFSNFGADVFLIKESDYVLVDARSKKGIGIGAEMVIAKQFSIPVVSLCPYESVYRPKYIDNICGESVSDWVHPFITGLSDYIAEDIDQAVNWMISHAEQPKSIKDLSVLNESIEYFKSKQNISI